MELHFGISRSDTYGRQIDCSSRSSRVVPTRRPAEVLYLHNKERQINWMDVYWIFTGFILAMLGTWKLISVLDVVISRSHTFYISCISQKDTDDIDTQGYR